MLLPARLSDEASAIVRPLRDRPISDLPDLLKRIRRLEALGLPVTVYPDAEELIQTRLLQQRIAATVTEIRRDPCYVLRYLRRVTTFVFPRSSRFIERAVSIVVRDDLARNGGSTPSRARDIRSPRRGRRRRIRAHHDEQAQRCASRSSSAASRAQPPNQRETHLPTHCLSNRTHSHPSSAALAGADDDLYDEGVIRRDLRSIRDIQDLASALRHSTLCAGLASQPLTKVICFPAKFLTKHYKKTVKSH